MAPTVPLPPKTGYEWTRIICDLCDEEKFEEAVMLGIELNAMKPGFCSYHLIIRKICKAYGKILDESDLKYHLSGTTSGVTGILYESEDYNNYIFKLYDMDYDTSLNFVPADVIELGCDLKSRFPVPAKIKP